MKFAKVTYTRELKNARIQLPKSKSISNRLLVMNELGNNCFTIKQLSESDDTKALLHGLQQMHDKQTLVDIGDAGTAARFICVLMAVKGFEGVLTGSSRMQERPMFALFDALRELGAQIDCLKKPGHLPVRFSKSKMQGGDVEVRADISSQFTSALMMAGPYLAGGLNLHLTGDIASAPYIAMTLKLMESSGIKCQWRGKVITIPQGRYLPTDFVVESDWSSTAPFYALSSLAGSVTFEFDDLRMSELQGDKRAIDIFQKLGVLSKSSSQGVRITGGGPVKSFVEIDFSESPDLAQAYIVATAAQLSEGLFTGLHTLHHKETDRYQAILTELKGIGIATRNDGFSTIRITSGTPLPRPSIHTYGDHRMAMAFAVLALKTHQVEIENSDVVAKSFPGFWDELQKTGLDVEFYELP